MLLLNNRGGFVGSQFYDAPSFNFDLSRPILTWYAREHEDSKIALQMVSHFWSFYSLPLIIPKMNPRKSILSRLLSRTPVHPHNPSLEPIPSHPHHFLLLPYPPLINLLPPPMTLILSCTDFLSILIRVFVPRLGR